MYCCLLLLLLLLPKLLVKNLRSYFYSQKEIKFNMPLASEYSTYNTVKAIFRPWISGKSPSKLFLLRSEADPDETGWGFIGGEHFPEIRFLNEILYTRETSCHVPEQIYSNFHCKSDRRSPISCCWEILAAMRSRRGCARPPPAQVRGFGQGQFRGGLL